MAILRVRRTNDPSKLANLSNAFEGELIANLLHDELWIGHGAGQPITKISDVITIDTLPATGVKDKLYIVKAENRMYRWDTVNSAFVELTSPGGTGSPGILHVATRADLPTTALDEELRFIEDENVFVVFETETNMWQETGLKRSDVYTKLEIDQALALKANTVHTHQDLEDRLTTLENEPDPAPYDDTDVKSQLSNHNIRIGTLESNTKGGIKSYATQSAFPVAGKDAFAYAEDTNKLYAAEVDPNNPAGDIIPALTADNDPSGIVLTSNGGSNSVLWKAFNNLPDSNADADGLVIDGGSRPAYVQISLPNTQSFKKLRMKAPYAYTQAAPVSFTFEKSDDNGATWQSIVVETSLAWAGAGEWKEWALNEVVSGKLFRFSNLLPVQAGYGFIRIQEIELISEANYIFQEIAGSGTSTGGFTQTQADALYEPKISTKGTAFNKNFGSAAGTVSEGNHTHAELHTHSNKSVLDNFSLDLDGSTLLFKGSKVDTKTVPTYASSSALPEGQAHGTLVTVGADVYVYDSTADPVKVEKSPTMTANVDSSGFTAYSNSENASTPSYYAFDGNMSTYFAPAGNLGSGVKTLGLTFPSAITIDSCDILAYGADSAGYNPKNWKIEVLLEDGVTWQTVYSNTAETWTSGAYKTFTWTPVKAKDLRITVTSTALSSYKPYFKDINIYGTTAGKWIKVGAKDVSSQTIAAAGNVSIATSKANPVVSVQVATATAGEYRNIKDSDLIDVLITSGNVKIVNNGSASATLRVIIQ